MKIAINTRFLIPGKLDGIGWFTHEVVSRMTRDHPEDTFYFFFDRPWSSEFIYSSNVRPVILRPPARHPVLWHIWFQYSLKKYLKAHPVDLFFSPDGFLPLTMKLPCIPVIHDLNFMHYPKELPRCVSAYYRHYFPLFTRESAHIITVSRFSKKDIVSEFAVKPEHVSVVYNGVDRIFRPLPDTEKRKTRDRLTRGIPYFVQVGSLLPRKNIPRLLRAFDRFRVASAETYKLVIAGRSMFGTREINKTLRTMQYASDVVFPGGLSREEIHRILASAEALVLVSYFEGFGMPLIEAMACQVPVVASTATSVPEICGEAALYVDPFSETDISRAMIRITSDRVLRDELIKKGNERVLLFNWENTAEKVWETMKEVIDNNSALS